ncbi:hypothetical protein QWY86_03500 [Pedobacter aquatilis]|uniref:hypothetical protein n=1 Tax=Pedobacter aquatilis TaxID=351343 RepID=UPI0025B4E6F4|nr:hypothetical protein [Pedobacter aquatilis]MDN3585716.1 hypothetical protein [Pedobacter aquatilis]
MVWNPLFLFGLFAESTNKHKYKKAGNKKALIFQGFSTLYIGGIVFVVSGGVVFFIVSGGVVVVLVVSIGAVVVVESVIVLSVEPAIFFDELHAEVATMIVAPKARLKINFFIRVEF